MANAANRRAPIELAVAAAVAVLLAAVVTLGLAPLAFVAVVAATAGLAVASRPQRGVLVLAALLPFDGLLNILPVPSLVSGWKEALLLGTLAAALLHPGRRPVFGRQAAPLPGWTATWVALIVLGVASALFVGGASGLFGVKVWFFWSLTLVVQRIAPLTAADRDRFVTILMLDGAITAAFGLLQQVLGGATLNRLGWEYGTDIRTTGNFLRSFSTFDGGPFPFAYFLAIVIVVGGSAALQEPRRIRSQWFFASAPVLALGLLSAFTRGAWVLAAVGIGWIAVTRHRRLLLAVPLALSLVVLVPADALSSALSSSSTIERTSVWEAALDVAATHPFGVGIGSAGGGAQRAAANEGRDPSDIVEPDNQYLLAFYEFGAVGLALLVLLMTGLFRAARAATSLPGVDGALANGSAGVIAGAAAAFVFASLLQIFPFDAYLWLLVGAVYGAVVERSGAIPPLVPVTDDVALATERELLHFASGEVRRPAPDEPPRIHRLRSDPPA